MDEQQTPAPEAGDDAVREETSSASEATENTGQDDPQPAEPDGDTPDGEETSPSKARRERRKAEMERLRQSEAEARAAYEAEVQRREKIKQAAESSQPPKETDFQDYNDYLMAAGAYHAARAWDERQSKEVDEKVSAHERQLEDIRNQQKQEAAENWAAQVAEAKSRYADFEQVVYTAPISDGVADMIVASDHAADLAYYLGTNRQEAEQISRMQPLDAARRLGAIEARLSLPRPRTQTNAPEPITPVKARAGAAKDPSKMTMAEYAAARKAGKI